MSKLQEKKIRLMLKKILQVVYLAVTYTKHSKVYQEFEKSEEYVKCFILTMIVQGKRD